MRHRDDAEHPTDMDAGQEAQEKSTENGSTEQELPEWVMIESVARGDEIEEHEARVEMLITIEKMMGIVRKGGQACAEPSAVREGHSGTLLGYDEEQSDECTAKLLLRGEYTHPQAVKIGKDGCAAKWEIEIGTPPRAVTVYVYPALDDAEVEQMELTELVRSVRQPDVWPETSGMSVGKAVAVQLKAGERHVQLRVVVRQLGKLPRKKSQAAERMAAMRGIQSAVLQRLRTKQPTAQDKWAKVAASPAEWTESAAPRLMEIPGDGSGTAEAMLLAIECVRAGPVEVIYVEKSADGRLVLDTAVAGAKPRKLNLGMAGKPRQGGRPMASVIGSWHPCVPTEYPEFGALRKPHGREICPAPVWAKCRKPETAEMKKLEEIMRRAEHERVGETRTCPFFTTYTGSNGYPSRCNPRGGCCGKLASCYTPVPGGRLPEEYEAARAQAVGKGRAEALSQRQQEGEKGAELRVEVMRHGGGKSPIRATARGKTCNGCAKVGAEGAGMDGEAGWWCDECWAPTRAEKEGGEMDEEEDGNAVMVEAGVVEGQERPEAQQAAAAKEADDAGDDDRYSVVDEDEEMGEGEEGEEEGEGEEGKGGSEGGQGGWKVVEGKDEKKKKKTKAAKAKAKARGKELKTVAGAVTKARTPPAKGSGSGGGSKGGQ